jgi:hypothetical protein
MLVTVNQPFGECGKVAMTLAAHEPRAKQNLTRGQVVKRLHRTFAVLVELKSSGRTIPVNACIEPKVIREFDFNRRSCIGAAAS